MRSVEIIIQHDWHPYKKGKFGHRARFTPGELHVEVIAGPRPRHLQPRSTSEAAKPQGQGGRSSSAPQPSDGTSSADALTLDYQPPDL